MQPARRLAVATLLLALAAAPAAAGELRGRVTLGLPGVALKDVAPVVYLQPPPGVAPPPAPAPAAAEVRQHSALFSPAFLVVVKGQPVSMPNDDTIYHNVFSFSAPNDFDLGLYPAGQARAVTFGSPGPVHIYCSIHESMNGTIFVAPTIWYAVASRDGGFRIPQVPPGTWRLRTWAESLPPTERSLEMGQGTLELRLDLAGGAAGAQPAAPAR